jgi:hypothetical protein
LRADELGSDTELTFYSDLIEYPEAKTALKKFGVENTKPYRKPINMCKHCGGVHITQLEVLGAYNGALFWHCEECLTLHLRFSARYTESLLRKAKGTWFNPNDWGDIEREDLD